VWSRGLVERGNLEVLYRVSRPVEIYRYFSGSRQLKADSRSPKLICCVLRVQVASEVEEPGGRREPTSLYFLSTGAPVYRCILHLLNLTYTQPLIKL